MMLLSAKQIQCADKCARRAGSDVKKAEQKTGKDSKRLKSCIAGCESDEKQKNCEKVSTLEGQRSQ